MSTTIPLTLDITKRSAERRPRLGGQKYPISDFTEMLEYVVANRIEEGDLNSKNLTLKELLSVVDESIERFVSMLCMDCGEDTTSEYYMVHDEVWKQATRSHETHGMLCIGCLERRIGRSLHKEDFPKNIAVNKVVLIPGNPNVSMRLRNRMTY